jgi:hypothetical protein
MKDPRHDYPQRAAAEKNLERINDLKDRYAHRKPICAAIIAIGIRNAAGEFIDPDAKARCILEPGHEGHHKPGPPA